MEEALLANAKAGTSDQGIRVPSGITGLEGDGGGVPARAPTRIMTNTNFSVTVTILLSHCVKHEVITMIVYYINSDRMSVVVSGVMEMMLFTVDYIIISDVKFKDICRVAY